MKTYHITLQGQDYTICLRSYSVEINGTRYKIRSLPARKLLFLTMEVDLPISGAHVMLVSGLWSMELVVDGVQVSKLWQRRQGCKFNGTSYITQRAAAAVFTAEGQKQIRETIAYYQNNAKVMMDAFTKMGVWFTGGTNSPYIWLKCPDGMGSWEYFDYLLHNAEIVGTPGEGFGKNGEGYFRLTAFGDADKTKEAMERIQKLTK
mgnify:CR=1 FL=1